MMVGIGISPLWWGREFGWGRLRPAPGGGMAGPCDCGEGWGRFGRQMVGMTGEAI